MNQERMDNPSNTGASNAGWKALYRIGGVAALLAVFVFRRNLGAELALLSNFGITRGVPTTPMITSIDWFKLFQDNWLVGLTLLNFFDLVEYALLGLVFLALYGALGQANKSATIIATTSGLIGITVYFASNQAFAMLALSERYAAATTDAQRSAYLAAGESLLAINNPDSIYQGTSIYVSLFLVLLAGLIISFVMLRSDVFSKATAVVGILANGIGICYFITLVFFPAIYWIPHPVSAPFRVIWYFLIALRLFKLGKSENGVKNG
jgi:hypothetical protein